MKRNFIVVGDIILDHNIFTTVQHPTLKDYPTEYNLLRDEYKLGGCGNVVSNLQSIGADSIFLYSAIGDDEHGRKIESILQSLHIPNYLRKVPGYHTTTKHRYYHDSSVVFQHANYINTEVLACISFCDEIEHILQTVRIDCMILCESETSSKGILSPEHCQNLISLANRYSIPTLVDPKEDIEKYKGCTLMKPNKDEAISLLQMDIDTPLLDIHMRIRTELQCTYSVITLSEKGASVFDGKDEFRYAHPGPLQIVDPIGGGDIVTSILCFFFNVIPIQTSMAIAVHLASMSGEQLGVVTVSRKHIEDVAFPSKLLSLEDVPLVRLLFANRRVGVTTGCFDLLHDGHRLCLQWCKEQCDILIVCINSDASVRSLKGASRPVQPLSTRMEALRSLQYVAYIVPFEEQDASRILAILRPNVFLKGGDYTTKKMVESDYVEETLIGPYLEGVSTTLQVTRRLLEQTF
jgi:D-beta-D-heptose 7-phosphate kinase/D-beta-D-heptose 1-phosphate adenosyltransferase